MTTTLDRSGSLQDLARLTPQTRDRYVDFLRAFSIGVVVIGHYVGANLFFENEKVVGRSIMQNHPGLWPVTWLLQIMPLFFFAGGFSNLVSHEAARRRGGSTAAFLRTRMARLLRPAAVFLGVWLAAQWLLHVVDAGGAGLLRLSFLPFGPLWFLAVYVVVVALSPVTIALHERFGYRVVVALGASAAAVDAVGLWGGRGGVRYWNFLFVWLLAHQLGYFYAKRTLGRPALLAAGGLAAMTILVAVVGYPASMVGVDGQRVSNMNPPTLAIVATTFWLVGLAMALRPAVTRWLRRPRAWIAVIAGNRFAMTLYLWHLTALLVAALLLRPLGLGTGPRIAVAGVVCVGLVGAFARFDRVGTNRSAGLAMQSGRRRTRRSDPQTRAT